ncbi:S24 family peptidase [Neisseria elongata]|uniref:S24 family peptidase n=1 Tax=Neisseria elongata TaxID=495 RepID=UPI000D3CE040|nr:MAG TPA: Repressor protein CI [Caudoviricetes sp.]
MEELKEFKDRLRKARIEKNISQVELGRLTGESQSKIAALESGRNKKPTNTVQLAEILGVSAYWLETGKGEMHPSPAQNEIKDIHRPMLWSSNDPLPEDDYTFAPYMKEQAFCGGAGSFEIPDYNGFRLPFGRATLRRKSINPDNVFCCTLTGDSMEERIAEDAAIAVDAGEKTIRDGKIYAFRHGDLFRVKYLSRLPGGRVKIKSHNPAYDDEEAGLEDIEVIGRVFWWSVLD